MKKITICFLLLNFQIFAQSTLKTCISNCEEKQEALNLYNAQDPLRLISRMCDDHSNIDQYYNNHNIRISLTRFKKSVNYYCKNQQQYYLDCIKKECPRQ